MAATVLGPAELAYWAQMLPLFDWAGLVPPVLVPRPMAAPVNASERRALEKLGLGLGDLFAGTDALLAARGAAREGALLDELAAIRDTALGSLAELAPRLAAVEAGLGKPLESTRENLRFAFDKLLERTRAAAAARTRPRPGRFAASPPRSPRGAAPPSASTGRSRGFSATGGRVSSGR